MNEFPWILMAIVIGLIVALLVAIFYKKTKKEGHEPDYRTFFNMGIIWIAIGIPLYLSSDSIALLALGFIFLIAGWANKDKWKEPHKPSPQTKKVLGILVALTVLLVMATAFLVFKQ